MLHCSKLREATDYSFKFDENGRKFSKRLEEIENTVGKREIAPNEQFFIFPQCFQKTCLKTMFVWETVKVYH